MKEALLAKLAEELYAAYRTHRAVERISVRYPELTAEDAYRVQEINCARAQAAGHRVTGYKVGLTARELMQSMEVEEPDYGVLYDGMEIPENGTANIEKMFEPKVEGEIAFVLGKDLQENATAEDVLEALAYVCAAFEVPETRIPGWQNKITDTVADNSSAGHYMCSTKHIAAQNLDFPNIGLTLRKNGAVIARGTAEVILGNPLKSVAWLGNKLRSHGKMLKKGDVVLAGALCGAHPAAAGDVFEAEFDVLGKLSVTFCQPVNGVPAEK